MNCLECPVYLTHNAHCGPAKKHAPADENRKTGDCVMLPYTIPITLGGTPDYDEILQWVWDNMNGAWATARYHSVDFTSTDEPLTVIRFELKSDATLFKLTFM